ncbi:putative glutamate synthase [NADPH] small chain [Magnetospirillum gryphiswaldense MSR-1 v2]|uniref:Glutamate synthase [NADPH] small chain n=1 Tax=Magnetospirillum gryphiswaldense (strain DSM 6361 / JCM 21280 / NBRC 15271 / MSR-1) TaxID=431944 RepID=V6F6P5_MAGGM|nr:NAD(P)-binding protein [Magnetospirillum gryphiswaldense]CDL01119.1 putative glutamate synthase [NADPH] small chain [Magnetospirillum gryphiswaldense MSR-1 v2]
MAKTTAKAITEGKNFRRYKDGATEYPQWTDAIFQASWSHKCPTYVLRTPPCSGSCPSGHDIRGWLDIVRGMEKPAADQSWQQYAFARMTEANPFPSIMGRVCPAPCEQGCNRNMVEEHIGINSVEHFIGDWAIQNAAGFAAPAVETGKHVAVIGGGPAGLSAAYQLRKRGIAVTLFEANAELGGFMRYGIPGYRVPRDVLDSECKRIIDMGVTVKTDTRVGRDITIAQLEEQFDAVFWGVGTHKGRGLPVPGWEGTPNCVSGIAFLKAFNEGRLQAVTGRIIVVGGGDTSIDVASVARRLGHIKEVSAQDRIEHVIFGEAAHDVASAAKREGCETTLTSLFPVEKMMAAQREVDDAKREGIDIKGGVMPLEVLKGADGRAIGLKMCKCTMNGMVPEPQAGTEFIIEADLIVAAIGQKGDLEGLPELDNGNGFINADKTMRIPGRPKHFVGGDVVRPHLLTTAIGHGRIAAASIAEFLETGEISKRPKVDVHHWKLLNKLRETNLSPAEYDGQPTRGTSDAKFAVHNYEDRGANDIITHEDLFLGHFTHNPRRHRQEIHIGADEVIGNFTERLLPLDEKQAVDEAKRCMSCGLCFECDNCVVFCPQTAVSRVAKNERTTGRYVETDYSKCIGCHICADVCPTGFIQMGLGE